MLGTPTHPFQIATLRQYLYQAKTEADLREAKLYLLGYFGHGVASIGIIMWRPEKRTFQTLTDQEAKKSIRKEMVNLPCQDAINP